MRLLLIVALTFAASHRLGAQDSEREIPRVVLVGDSIRLSYAPLVKELMTGRATIVSPKPNGQDSRNVLRNLQSWVIDEQPDIVHFNAGIHDTKYFKATDSFQVAPADYETNLRAIVAAIRAKTSAKIIFATTTPIISDRAAAKRSNRDYELLRESVETYNGIARKVMKESDIPINDLHAAFSKNQISTTSLISDDGVHLTAAGRKLAAECVHTAIAAHLASQVEPNEIWKIDEWSQVPPVKWLDDDTPAKIRSLTFESEIFEGHTTDVFAFYATPGSISGDLSMDTNLPAVVLIHGGGGTAFTDWVMLWAKRGYAAIAMDLSGRRPEAPKFDPATGELISGVRTKRSRLERGGPEADHVAKFDNVGDDMTDDWQFHSVAAVMRAHSLIRSFPEVDAERTAVTGISWGGYMTCLTASLDVRFKAAVPVYGCGFLYDGESVQKSLIDRLSQKKQREWIRIYDPSAWLPKCRVPILFVNGTNDKHYPLDSYMRSYDLVPGPKQLRIQAGMLHSHQRGWEPAEVGLFIDQHINSGDALPKISEPKVRGRIAFVDVESAVPIQEGAIVYSTDNGPLIARKWKTTSAKLADDRKAMTAEIPANATAWLMTVTDTRNAMVSTRVNFVD